MKNNYAVKIHNVGKKYKIGIQSEAANCNTLRETISQKSRDILNPKTYSFYRAISEDFWALQDINLEIKRGERFGIVGRNGCGKSTLLKIISRITEPTTGTVDINGRITSLLEVGTGFHPELTGRENIFLNGSILGMKRAEVKQKFDEIVAFAEVEKFLDTPVKRFSSGMQARLGFAVGAHLKSDILILDEVFAVGDLAFRKKCMKKILDICETENKTVLFVSHNVEFFRQLCTKAMILQEGRSVFQGDTADTLDIYQEMIKDG